jgi:hypothetical protein
MINFREILRRKNVASKTYRAKNFAIAIKHQDPLVIKEIKTKETKQMSFKSILKTVGVDFLKGLGIADSVATVITPVLGPVLGPSASELLQLFLKGISGAEVLITGAQQGAAKKETAGTIITAEIPTLDSIIASLGSNVVVPANLQAAIGPGIDGAVALVNAITQILEGLSAKGTDAVVPISAKQATTLK